MIYPQDTEKLRQGIVLIQVGDRDVNNTNPSIYSVNGLFGKNAINCMRCSMFYNNIDICFIIGHLSLISSRLSYDVYTVEVQEGKGQDKNKKEMFKINQNHSKM